MFVFGLWFGSRSCSRSCSGVSVGLDLGPGPHCSAGRRRHASRPTDPTTPFLQARKLELPIRRAELREPRCRDRTAGTNKWARANKERWRRRRRGYHWCCCCCCCVLLLLLLLLLLLQFFPPPLSPVRESIFSIVTDCCDKIR